MLIGRKLLYGASCPAVSQRALQQQVLIIVNSSSVLYSLAASRSDWAVINVPNVFLNSSDKVISAVNHPILARVIFLICMSKIILIGC